MIALEVSKDTVKASAYLLDPNKIVAVSYDPNPSSKVVVQGSYTAALIGLGRAAVPNRPANQGTIALS